MSGRSAAWVAHLPWAQGVRCVQIAPAPTNRCWPPERKSFLACKVRTRLLKLHFDRQSSTTSGGPSRARESTPWESDTTGELRYAIDEHCYATGRIDSISMRSVIPLFAFAVLFELPAAADVALAAAHRWRNRGGRATPVRRKPTGRALSRLPVSLKKKTFSATGPGVGAGAVPERRARPISYRPRPRLAIRLEYPSPPRYEKHACLRPDRRGPPTWTGRYSSTAVADKDTAPGKIYEHLWFADQQRTEREIILYLPLYKPVKALGIGDRIHTLANGTGGEPIERWATAHGAANGRR